MGSRPVGACYAPVMPPIRGSRRGIVALLALAVLGVLLSVWLGRRTPPPRAMSSTEISMGRACSQATADWLDDLNRTAQGARIRAAYCTAAEGRLIQVEMRASDGRAQEGTYSLQLQLDGR